MSDEVVVPDMEQLWNEEASARAAGSEEPPVVTETKQVEETPAVEDTAPDPLAELRNQVSALSSQLGTVTSDLKSAQGRIAAWQREQAEAAKKAAQAVTEAPTAGQMAAAVANPETWDQLKKEFPDWAIATEQYVDAKLSAVKIPAAGTDTGAVEALKSEMVALKGQFDATVAELLVETQHRGWKKTVKTEEFKTWQAAQPREIQALGGSADPEDAVRMLDLFETSRSAKKQEHDRADDLANRRKENLDVAAATPKGVKQPRATAVDTSQMTPEQLWDYEAAQRERRRAAQGY